MSNAVPPGPAHSVPPIAARRPVRRHLHGNMLVDDYVWLRDRDHSEVRAYLEAENAYADVVLSPVADLRESLYQEMLGRIQQTDLSVPYRQGDWFYYSRTEEGKQYPIHCRSRREGGEEVILLDVNTLAEGKPFMALGSFVVSDDGHLLAFSSDDSGYREYLLQVKDLRNGELMSLRVPRTGSIAWAADNRTLFYTVEDEAKRHHRLFRLDITGGDPVLVHEEHDDAFNLSVARTRSNEWLLLMAASHTTSDVQILPAGTPDQRWRLVAPRVPDREYDLDHWGDHFYIRVNDLGRNFRIVEAPVANPGPDQWREVLPHDPDTMLEGVECFADHWVTWERRAGLPCIRIAVFSSGNTHHVTFPEPVYDAYPGNNRLWEATVFRFGYQSLVTPPSVFDYDISQRIRTLRKQVEVLGGYGADAYRSERIEATAPDGTVIPVSIVTRRDTPRDGTAGLLLTGYGAYGIPYPVSFSSARLSLLDRGFVMAIAHVRGGGELGKPWHDAGRMAQKEHSFDDFITTADHLVAEGFVARNRLVIEGGSAGGLLVGAVVNRRPDLCCAAVLQVPFVDVINTMLDTGLPLTVGEFEEWGNPALEGDYGVMARYCPYSNLRKTDYPAMLVRTSLHDSQVMYWEPAKYVAKLRTLTTGRGPQLLVTNMGAGHGGASGRYDRLREIALDYAFILWIAGSAAGSGARAVLSLKQES